MDEKIEPDLFARLMRLSPPTRKDLLEYLGQGPVSARDLLGPGRLPGEAPAPPQATDVTEIG